MAEFIFLGSVKTLKMYPQDRLGAVDLLPFHPLTPDLSVAECGALARRVGARLRREEPAMSFFFFGGADVEGGRSLASRRRQLGWFEGTVRGSPDLGTCQPRAGLTGLGAAPYMANFNLSLNTDQPHVGRAVLKKIRTACNFVSLAVAGWEN